MTTTLRSVFVALAAFALAACSQNKPAAVAAPGACENPDMVVATYSGKNVTLKEVDKLVAGQLKDLEKKKFEQRQQAIQGFIVQELVKERAQKAGLTEEVWVQQNVEGKVEPVSDEEAKKFFDELTAQGRIPPGTMFEGPVKMQIVQALSGKKREESMAKIFGDMMKEAKVEVLLQEARVQVEAKGPTRGPADAKVTIVEFSDFQCPYCSRAEESVDQVMTNYAGKVRIVFRHYPLPFHKEAPKAAEASACADEQGKFWDMHKVLFKNQGKLMPDDLKGHAAAIGLDAGKFTECLDSGKMKAVVDADKAEGEKAGVNGTPAFFINGIPLSGAQPFAAFEKIINQELERAK